MVSNINEALLDGISKIDITPTMFKEATEHYKAIANLLIDNDIASVFYPQGSMATGTVVRPYDKDDEETYYDLDMVCVVEDASPKSTTPQELRSRVISVFEGNATYCNMYSIEDECITIEYARTEVRSGFNLDIVIGVKPSDKTVDDYQVAGIDPTWAEQDLSLARENPIGWIGSNPHALSDWFMEKNMPFAEYNKETRLKKLYEMNKSVYASIEEVPQEMQRSALQHAVQLAKRSRDIFYSRKNNGAKKPASCALLVSIAKCAVNMPPSSTAQEILTRFVFIAKAKALPIEVANPVFPDSFNSGWTTNDFTTYYCWLDTIEDNLSVIDDMDLKKSASVLNEMLGMSLAGASAVIPVGKPKISGAIPVKPWRSFFD